MMAGVRTASSALLSTIFKLNSLSIAKNVIKTQSVYPKVLNNYFRNSQCAVSFHTSNSLRGLSEFFDDKENWGASTVKVGRSWRVEELRIKSNEDLHKLWYVLLKEKNMLLTMEEECKREYQLFPNPERIDKVEESMNNLERVVRERNRAFWLLETGETGERPCGPVRDPLGRRFIMQYSEHFVPVHMNKRTNKKNLNYGPDQVKFLKLMREQGFQEKKKKYNRIRNHVCHLLRRFPNMSEEAIQKQYPEVNLARLRRLKMSLGHHLYNEG